MKKILYSVFSAVALLSIAACSNNDEELGGALNMGGASNPNAPTTILASTETSGSTRTALQDDGNGAFNVVWSEGDELCMDLVRTGTPGGKDHFSFALEEGVGMTSGRFTSSETVNWSDYNYIEAYHGVVVEAPNSEHPNDYFYYWPAQQVYHADGKISSPMFFYQNIKNDAVPTLAFKNLGGLLCLKLKGATTITSIQVETDEVNSGLMKGIEKNSTGISLAAIDEGKGSDVITLDLGEGVSLTHEGVDFYIAMPENTYHGVKIMVTDSYGYVQTKRMKSTSALDIKRSQITIVSLTVQDLTRGTAKRDNDIDVEWIQLWKDGPKFAVYNVGASAVDGDNSRGDLYNFKHTDNSSNTYYRIIDYATKAWGNNWRMPTKDEFDALLANCDYEWVNGTGKDGCLFTGKGAYSANSIYLPAVNDVSGLGYAGSYWSSTEATTIYSTPKAYSLSIHYTQGNKVTSQEQNNKFSVRAVLKEN